MIIDSKNIEGIDFRLFDDFMNVIKSVDNTFPLTLFYAINDDCVVFETTIPKGSFIFNFTNVTLDKDDPNYDEYYLIRVENSNTFDRWSVSDLWCWYNPSENSLGDLVHDIKMYIDNCELWTVENDEDYTAFDRLDFLLPLNPKRSE